MSKTLRLLAALFGALVCLSCAAFAENRPPLDESRHPKEAAVLFDCGFFTGTDRGAELSRALTREEAAVLVLRVMGGEADLFDAELPFSDVSAWARPHVSRLWEAGIVRGVSAGRFGAAEPVTARQFYTMLLRALGHTEFSADGALEYAVSCGLLDPAELPREGFTRDDALYACYRALNAVPEGESEPYAVLRARRIENSYGMPAAEAVTGRSRVYDCLAESLRAVQALDGYTLVKRGLYREEGGSTRSEGRFDCDVRVLPGGACWYDITALDGSADALVPERRLNVYADGRVLAVREQGENGSWNAAAVPDALLRRYTGVYEYLFGPDLDYISRFDYAEEDGCIVLTGFSSRFELMADPTSDYDSLYFFDVVIRISPETHLPLSAVCTYRDTWETNGETLRVSYTSTYTLEDIGRTALPEDTHGLFLALRAAP